MYSLSYLYVPYDIEMIGEKEREREKLNCGKIYHLIWAGSPQHIKNVCLL